MSIPLKKNKLNYTQMEKHAFFVVKALKQFRYYILHSHSIVYVPETAVKSVMTQQDIGVNKRTKWVAKIKEYDITIKPTNLVRVRGLCKLIVENKGSLLEGIASKRMIFLVSSTDPWFSNVVY